MVKILDIEKYAALFRQVRYAKAPSSKLPLWTTKRYIATQHNTSMKLLDFNGLFRNLDSEINSSHAMDSSLMSPQFLSTAITMSTVVVASGPEAVVLDPEVDGLVVALEVAGTSEAYWAESAKSWGMLRLDWHGGHRSTESGKKVVIGHLWLDHGRTESEGIGVTVQLRWDHGSPVTEGESVGIQLWLPHHPGEASCHLEG